MVTQTLTVVLTSSVLPFPTGSTLSSQANCQNLGGLELWSRYGGHVIKTRLQLVCCALVWEPGCLVISGSRKEGVSGMEYGRTEKLSWGAEGLQRI